eukprot:CAMPEP_0119042424 /NCGR_PEP_ID=MMETSP1177-20130426/15151_1 /TAXON_ID=2985 /ORGANISM="Ochromonas sp, Strain CCMP1899" /LENGTH=166 /DNA_ID=CAMNT_0007009217 /DNA_START=148 /DNA_END=648 /DNA_ORIENTATION=+
MRRLFKSSSRRMFSEAVASKAVISEVTPVADLNNVLIVTKSCAKRIKNLRNKEKNEALVLRISVEGGGCSGFSYVFKMEDRLKAALEAIPPEDDEEIIEDKVFERDGSAVVIDSISFDMVKGSTIDFKEELIRSAFVVSNNPQSESACGCGSSFASKNFASNPALD